MKVSEAMTKEVAVAEPGTVIREAARKMRSLDVGMLPVYNGREPLGVVTDRDITVRSTAEGCDPCSTTVDAIMTKDIVTCFGDDDLESAARMMEEAQVRRLLVMDHVGCLVGVISLGDIAARGAPGIACEAFGRIVESPPVDTRPVQG